ncbi:MAG: potassium transporter TrkG [Bacteroidota bacterium]
MKDIKRFISKLRENLNIRLYDTKPKAERFLDNWSIFMVIAGLFSYLQYHGFPHHDIVNAVFVYSFKSLIGLQILKYLVGYVYSFQPLEYFLRTKKEATLLIIFIVVITLRLFGFDTVYWLGEEFNFHGDIMLLRSYMNQLYFLFFFFMEISRVSLRIPTINLPPPTLLLMSFFGLIFIGALLLMLPKMTVMEGSMSFFDALFTSLSASCVTGLIVVDTATYFTVKGQFVIMLLIQLGGLNIITFATLFALMMKRNMGIKHQSIIQDNFSVGSIKESKTLLQKVFLFSFLIEFIGTVIIFFSWGNNIVFHNFRDKAFKSIFHSVSAFNNAGFSTLSNGLYEDSIMFNIPLQLVIAFLIILGSTGFPVLHEIFNFYKLRTIWFNHWKKFSLNSKLGLYTTFALLVSGTVAFFFLEQDFTLKKMGLGNQIVHSFFQSVTTRTAGFNTVDIGSIGIPMTIFMLVLMYIGASPASTGGGIKTNTFTVLFLSAFATLRGKKTINIDRQSISFESVDKSLLIFLFSISIILISVFLLSITESDKKIIDIIFEEVSAFATAGISRGITADLSTGGRIIIMVSMFVGRVGLLTLAYALSQQTISTDYTYPKAKIIIG